MNFGKLDYETQRFCVFVLDDHQRIPIAAENETVEAYTWEPKRKGNCLLRSQWNGFPNDFRNLFV